jgi:hypothetical protein
MTVMTVTTCMVALVMLVTWNTHPLLVVLFLAVLLPLEGVLLSSTLVKVSSGGEGCCSNWHHRQLDVLCAGIQETDTLRACYWHSVCKQLLWLALPVCNVTVAAFSIQRRW